MKYSTMKIIFENLHFHKGLVIKYLSNKELLKKLISNMIHDNNISCDILPKDIICKHSEAIKDIKNYLESL